MVCTFCIVVLIDGVLVFLFLPDALICECSCAYFLHEIHPSPEQERGEQKEEQSPTA